MKSGKGISFECRKIESNKVQEGRKEDEESQLGMEREKMIEEVKEYIKYLSYVFHRNGRQEAQVRDKVKKEIAIMRYGEVWDQGKECLRTIRRGESDFSMRQFDS